jgi:hypothetical protein
MTIQAIFEYKKRLSETEKKLLKSSKKSDKASYKSINSLFYRIKTESLYSYGKIYQ